MFRSRAMYLHKCSRDIPIYIKTKLRILHTSVCKSMLNDVYYFTHIRTYQHTLTSDSKILVVAEYFISIIWWNDNAYYKASHARIKCHFSHHYLSISWWFKCIDIKYCMKINIHTLNAFPCVIKYTTLFSLATIFKGLNTVLNIVQEWIIMVDISTI